MHQYLWSLVFAMALVSGAVVRRVVRLAALSPRPVAVNSH
jgi:hypothetical protein